jgi:basic amino acid/polyamine antiporter, APA family
MNPETRPGLVRAIGRFDLTAAIVNGVIGSAIFGMPARIAELTGPWSPVAYLAAGLGILTLVLCFAEVASRYREAGGPYLYARDAFGPVVGFQAGWLTFWIRVTALAANLNVFVEYLAQGVPGASSGAGRVAAITLLLALITVVNLLGVRQATWAVDLLTLAKLLPLLLLVVLGLPRVRAEVLAGQAVAAPDWTQAVLLLVFAYGGFETPLIPAGETRDPRRDTAFALLVAIAVVAAVYMLVQLVIVGTLPHAAGVRAPVAAAFGGLVGPTGVALASAGAMISIGGWATGSVLQSPRVLFSMAERRELPAALARVHAGWRTPHVAILVYSGLALALALPGSFEGNATLSAIVRLVTYGLTCAALPVLRRREAAAPGFRLPAASVIVPAALLFCLWLLSTRTFAQAWILGGIMLAGGVLHWLGARRASPVLTGGDRRSE